MILVDLKGFGASPKPSDDRYSIQDQADLVSDLIVRNDLRDLTLVGHSFGGGVALFAALTLAVRAPDHLTSLVLIDSIAYPQRVPAFIRVLRTAVLGRVALHLLSARMSVRHILELAYFKDTRITLDQVEAYAAPLRSSGGRQALLSTARRLIPEDLDQIVARYSSIGLPSLIIWGREDEIVPLSMGERLHATLSNSRLVVIDDCGHIPQEEKADETLRVLSRFLNEPHSPLRMDPSR